MLLNISKVIDFMSSRNIRMHVTYAEGYWVFVVEIVSLIMYIFVDV